MNALIYDIEIIKAVPDRKFPNEAGIEYCAGWQDHANMGISVIGAWDDSSDRYRVFCKDNFDEFQKLVDAADHLVSFNGISFDNVVLSHNGINMPVERNYDILVELWLASGLALRFDYKTHGGYGLDATCEANFGTKKSGHGAYAPVDWQRGNIGTVIDYCLNDIRLTKQLWDKIIKGGTIASPKNPGRRLALRDPNPCPKEGAFSE